MPPRWCTECVQSGLYMSDPGEGQMPESANSIQGVDVRRSARCIKIWSARSVACYCQKMETLMSERGFQGKQAFLRTGSCDFPAGCNTQVMPMADQLLKAVPGPLQQYRGPAVQVHSLTLQDVPGQVRHHQGYSQHNQVQWPIFMPVRPLSLCRLPAHILCKVGQSGESDAEADGVREALRPCRCSDSKEPYRLGNYE